MKNREDIREDSDEGKKMYEKIKGKAAAAALFLLAVSLLPVIWLGGYNHPTGDDYYYGAKTHRIWQETGDLGRVLEEALQGVKETYQTWQGTYSALFLMHLPPNLFSDRAYAYVTAGLLLLFTAGIFYLLKPLLTTGGRKGLAEWAIVSSVISMLCVQTVDFQGESFFWYNGSMYYTGYFAATLFFFGIMLRYLQNGGRYRIGLLLLLAAFLAGGNYVSLLPCLLLTAATGIFLIVKKSPGLWAVLAATLTLGIGLSVSAAAPGNAVRQSDMLRIPAWKAVFKSLEQGLRYTDAWTDKWWVFTALLLTPVFWYICKKKKEWLFPHPLLVLGFLYGIFCSMSCPLFYTMNSTGPARAVAIIYYGFILTSLGGYFYMVGYVCSLTRKERHLQLSEEIRGKLPLAGLLCAALLLGMQLAGGAFAECTAIKAVKLLANGEAAAYHREYEERLALLNDETLDTVVLTPFTARPEMLYVGDLPGNADHPVNQRTALYFGKKAICVQYP